MEKITLQVNGREMTFSEKELTSILEEHFKRKGPIEGEWFNVNPSSIDQQLFEKERTDDLQEKLRFYIQYAFEELKENPEKNKAFRILIPPRNIEHYGDEPSVSKLRNFASQMGDHMGFLWEWALMLAQRIANGESWESLCNEPDTANWYLLIEFDEHSKRVGGSKRCSFNPPAAYIYSYTYWDKDWVNTTVPLVVDYDD